MIRVPKTYDVPTNKKQSVSWRSEDQNLYSSTPTSSTQASATNEKQKDDRWGGHLYVDIIWTLALYTELCTEIGRQ